MIVLLVGVVCYYIGWKYGPAIDAYAEEHKWSQKIKRLFKGAE